MVRKLSDLILYSSLWIGTCAASLVTLTYDMTGSGLRMDAYVGFVFCGTIVLYAAHRLTGIEIVKKYSDQGRFSVISTYQSHILIYGLFGAAGGLYFLLKLPLETMIWLALPAFFSLMYVAPLGRKRWRDYPYVKIFLIAGVWSALTALIPAVHAGAVDWVTGSGIFFERALFIFAITIPFDIRDVQVDNATDLPTLPHTLGIRRAKILALLALCLSLSICLLLVATHGYHSNSIIPYAVVYGLTGVLIWNSAPGMDDHYFSGVLDGTMFLLAFGYWLWSCVV